MKTLVIVAHPNLEQSKVNRTWMNRLQQEENISVHNLYAHYPTFEIDVEKEQQLLLEHDRIILQFPFYWYSSPALLKQWQDWVLTYGWAYGSRGTKLRGKELMLVISTGGPETAYQAGGYNHFSMSELIKPFQATANLTGMRFLPSFTKHGVRLLTIEHIRESAEELVRHLKNNY
ncbi:NAD(P)H-dependent oxidoreductase [Neobacillus cucumis]|uniref:NAD(P)H-dependent oxidoreductase n=1 Tax=Neobacillus cucumis TaxID=1740721 RepID=UPI0018E01DC1|nr:NAD(P)H-dependent oxidoreductase [Neobacillus cucumis]MBI0579991.1 NAD(P)H-dependent oxidoreductase [Neobacillus cucumis]WHY94449.1 NAD(P)H-dependent oxidoreductase [Neobacillus cucumis]